GYMAPEQVRGEAIDRRADVFSVGVMLWELIAKKRMVSPSDEEVAVLARRMSGSDPSVREFASDDVPEALIAVCDRAMAGAASDRYTTALEFHDALVACMGSERAERRKVADLMLEHFREERSK